MRVTKIRMLIIGMMHLVFLLRAAVTTMRTRVTITEQARPSTSIHLVIIVIVIVMIITIVIISIMITTIVIIIVIMMMITIQRKKVNLQRLPLLTDAQPCPGCC